MDQGPRGHPNAHPIFVSTPFDSRVPVTCVALRTGPPVLHQMLRINRVEFQDLQPLY